MTSKANHSASAALSDVDKDVLALWRLWRSFGATINDFNRQFREEPGQHLDDDDALCQRHDIAIDKQLSIVAELQAKVRTSVLAIGAVLTILILEEKDFDPFEPAEGMHRAMLAALRPQLVGEIAEDADRVLAQSEEARA